MVQESEDVDDAVAVQPDADFVRQLYDHAGVALIATDTQLRIRLWNAAAARLFGAGALQMIGVPLITVFPQKRRRVASRMLLRAISTGRIGTFEFKHRDERGQPCELAVTVSPVVEGTGRSVGASLCITDITRRVRLQEQLASTRRLASLGQMAGALAHHFNNILGGAVTSVDFALQGDDDRLRDRVLGQTAAALGRATRLMSGLLAFAEGDPHDVDMVDVTETVLSYIDRVESHLAEARISVQLHPSRIPVTPVPRKQLTTILQHLVDNAVEAMPDGGVLRLELAPADEYVAIRLEDSGCGMDAGALQRIFEPFYSTKAKGRSADTRNPGLGLAIVHGMVHAIGGKIDVWSRPGHGTRVAVLLPRTPRSWQS